MSRVLRAAAAAALLALPVPAAAQTLADALIAAYRSSNLLEQNRAVLRAADEDVAQAVSALRPVVNFVLQSSATSARVQPQGSPVTVRVNDLSASLALSAEITIYDFGRNRLAIEGTEAAVLATREALVGVEQNVLFQAVAAFLDVRAATSTVSLREANVRLISEELRAVRDRFEVGEITRTDVSIAEARLAGARGQLAVAQGDLAIARETYRAVTGAYPGQLASPPATPALPASLEAAQGIARDRHPSIREARHRVTGAELAVTRVGLLGQGSITGGANLSVTDERRDSSSLSLRYSRPIYTGGRNPSLHRQAMAQRDAARSGLQQTTVQVVEQVGRAWSNLAVAVAQIQASDSQISAAQTAFEGIRQEAELGARTTLDVLNAEQELLDARTARIQAETGRYLAVYSLLSSMGLLTVEHLGLGIPTYDPAAYYNAVRNAPARSPQGEQLDRILQRGLR